MHVSSWLLRAMILFWTQVKKPSNSTVHKLPRDRWDKQHKEESAQPSLTNIRSAEMLWLGKYLSCKLWITCPKMQRHQRGPWTLTCLPGNMCFEGSELGDRSIRFIATLHWFLMGVRSSSTWMDLLKRLAVLCVMPAYRNTTQFCGF